MRLVLAALAVVVGMGAFSGCGADQEPTTQGPDEATYTATNKAPLSDASPDDCPQANKGKVEGAKDIRVAGQDGRPRRRPRKLVVAREITLSCLRWVGWGNPAARAAGISQELDCKPTCATGGLSQRVVSLRVSGLKRCRGRRFYSQARLVYPRQGAKPLRVFTVVPCEQ